MPFSSNRDAIPPGTLDALILKTLERAKQLHGFGIANTIRTISESILQVEEGSLYPSLQRMLVKGWVTAEWGKIAENRRARYYKLTPSGRLQLGQQVKRHDRISHAIARVLQPVYVGHT